MKRNQSRSGSPTGTVFSGISNYKDSSYRPISGKNAPAVPSIDYRSISRTHFEELSKYLAVYLSKASPETRSTARQKLTRLTIQQFHELSTDVYDELCRRKREKEVPFLPVREEFHPKRNQARQKLATLPTSRFEDLSSDVYFELIRRYPEFQEEPPTDFSPASNYDDYPSPDFQPRPSLLNRSNTRPQEDRASDNDYSGRRSEDRRRPSEQMDLGSSGRRSEEDRDRGFSSSASRRKPSQDIYAPSRTSEEDRGYAASSGSRRKPSQDTTRSGLGGHRPSVSATSDSMSTANGQSNTASSGMVIPNKSTITEEVIEVPYGRDRDARESSSTANDDDAEQNESDASPLSPVVGLSGLTARLRQADDDDDIVVGNSRNDDYFDRRSNGRASVASDRSIGRNGGRMSATGNVSAGEDQNKLRRDYEFKIATMQNQITSLQRDLSNMEEKESQWTSGEQRVRQMEEELIGLRRRAEEQSTAMRALNKELDEVRESRLKERDRAARRQQEDEDEIRMLRDRLETLESEQNTGQGGADPELVEQLRGDMDGLFNDLSELSRRNDELLSARDNDMNVIRDLDSQLKEYKRKYEQAKTELRSVKATSQLYMQGPQLDKSEDQLPVSPDGGVLDIHVTAFLSGIDGLLTAGRSKAPTQVLSPMKSVINAVTAIIDDVRAFERSPARDRSDVGSATLRSLCERADVTLSNLVAATKTHATSSGMSPVSLLDAAASHVSATVTEIGKTVNIRKATKAEQEQFTLAAASGSSATNGFAPSLKSIDESKSPTHMRKGSAASSASRRNDFITSPTSSRQDYRRRLGSPGDDSSDQTNSPPPNFDRPFQGSGSATTEGSEDAWTELKPYLEAQTESIVYAIQSVLSGVRTSTPSMTLNENVTQIITIVSSIVAVCNDNLPPASAQQGNDILRELSEQANTLSEVQASGENTKESRQTMAKSSFAVANAMKALMKL